MTKLAKKTNRQTIAHITQNCTHITTVHSKLMTNNMKPTKHYWRWFEGGYRKSVLQSWFEYTHVSVTISFKSFLMLLYIFYKNNDNSWISCMPQQSMVFIVENLFEFITSSSTSILLYSKYKLVIKYLKAF